jgi:hypothetical protein
MTVNEQFRTQRQHLAGLLLVLLFVFLACSPNLRSTNIDDLDSAHHILDSYFFYDLAHNPPHGHFAAYVTNYHKQDPALGFLFWPPLFPAVAGMLCLVLGAHVLTVRLAILLFGAIFGVSFYEILRREVGWLMAAAATCAAISAPGVFWSYNQIMLELPTLAVMCVAVLAVRHMVDRAETPTSYPRAIGTAAICAAVIYAKQPAWFLYPCLLLMALQSPGLRRKRETYVALAAWAIFCVPLALFTLKFGHANLAQSVGSNTQLIMPTYKSVPRWSLAAWTFYPRYAFSLLNPLVALLGLAGLVLCVRRDFRRSHLLWLSWFVLFFVTFSFYDNRVSRHATFWWPAWVALAAAFLSWVGHRLNPKIARLLPLLLVLPIAWQLPADFHQDYSDFHDERPIIASLYAGRDPGNVLLFGSDKQTFIALIREFDVNRRDVAVRGERLLDGGADLGKICQSYRTREVLVELGPDDSLQRHPEFEPLESSPQFVRETSTTYPRRGKPMQVFVYRYTGPIDSKMAEIPLSDKLL